MRQTSLAVAVAMALVGCGPASERKARPDGARLASFSPEQVTTRIVGATPEQRQVLTEILAGLGPTPLPPIEIASAEPNWEGAAPNSVELKVATDDTEWLANWHAKVVAQAFRVRSQERGLPPVNYVSYGKSGSLMADDPASVASEDSLTLSQAQEIARRMRAAASEHDVEIRTLELVKPRRFAFVLVLQSDNVDSFLRGGYEEVLEPLDELRARGYDGRYVEVCDDKGGIAHVAGAASLTRRVTSGAVPRSLRCRGSFAAPEPRASALPRIVGASPPQRRLLEQIFEGMGPTQISSAKVKPAGDFWTPYRPNSVVLTMTFLPGREQRAWWEASLVADAFSDGSRLLDLPPVTAYETPSDGISLDGPDLPPVVESSLTLSELEHEVRIAAEESDSELIDLQILKPRLLAPVFTLQVDDPAEFLQNRTRVLFGLLEPLDLAGYLIQLVDQDGRLVWSSVDGVVRPELEGCNPEARYGGPPTPPPPPCPAD